MEKNREKKQGRVKINKIVNRIKWQLGQTSEINIIEGKQRRINTQKKTRNLISKETILKSCV